MGGSRLTVIQPDRPNMNFRRICMEDTDFKAFAADMPGLSVADVGAGKRTGWRGKYVEGSYSQVWTMFEAADGGFRGYTRMRDDVDGAKMRGWGSWRLTPLHEQEPDVERLPPEEPAAQLPPEAVTDAVARAVADDLGMSPGDVGPYLSTSLGADMTRGDGDTARAVVVEMWLDAEGRLPRADRAARAIRAMARRAPRSSACATGCTPSKARSSDSPPFRMSRPACSKRPTWKISGKPRTISIPPPSAPMRGLRPMSARPSDRAGGERACTCNGQGPGHIDIYRAAEDNPMRASGRFAAPNMRDMGHAISTLEIAQAPWDGLAPAAELRLFSHRPARDE